MVRFSDAGQIEGGLRLVEKRHAALVALAEVRRVAVVEHVDGQLLAVLQPVYHIGRLHFLGEGTLQDHIVADVRGDALRGRRRGGGGVRRRGR